MVAARRVRGHYAYTWLNSPRTSAPVAVRHVPMSDRIEGSSTSALPRQPHEASSVGARTPEAAAMPHHVPDHALLGALRARPSRPPEAMLLRRQTGLQIEATLPTLAHYARGVIGSTFDEGEFRRAMQVSVTTPEKRCELANKWIWPRIYPLPPGELEPLGHGNDNAVYDDPSKPDEVVKVSVWLMSLLANWNALFNRTGGDPMPETLWEEGREIAKLEARRYRRLERAFPPGSVPRQSVAVKEMPVRGAVLQHLLAGGTRPLGARVGPALDPDGTYLFPALVRIQQRVEALARPSARHFSVSLRFVELADDPTSDDLYAYMNDAWLLNKPVPFDEAAFKHCIQGSGLESFYERIVHDSAPAEIDSVRDFVSRAIKYINGTREHLDVGGDGNVVFDGGRYYLPDALPAPVHLTTIDTTARLLRAVKARTVVAPLDVHCARIVLTYIRTFNAMAHVLGIRERIHTLTQQEERESFGSRALMRALRPAESHLPPASPSRFAPAPVLFTLAPTPWGLRAA